MRLTHWVLVALVGLGLTGLATLSIVVPNGMWTTPSVVAVALMFVTVVALAVVPPPMPRGDDNDAPSIWLIGPLACMYGALLVIGAIALALGLLQKHTASWLAIALWCGTSVVAYAVLRAATGVVATAAERTAIASTDARTQWLALIRRHAAQTNQEHARRLLESLVERIRYAANDLGTQNVAENAAIATLLTQLGSAVESPDKLTRLVRMIETLLEQRELAALASRSRS